jgi:hypothetical protein
LKGRSSTFEAHVQCLCDRFAQFNAKFHIAFFHLCVHDEITDYHTHDDKSSNITTPDVNAVIAVVTLPYQD